MQPGNQTNKGAWGARQAQCNPKDPKRRAAFLAASVARLKSEYIVLSTKAQLGVHINALFEKLDIDHDGNIDKEEFMTQMLRVGKAHPFYHCEQGTLDGEEVHILELKDHLIRIFAAADKDGNGFIDRSEFEDVLMHEIEQMPDLETARNFLMSLIAQSRLSVYFGYGANMSPEGMQSKGLTPIRSYRAVLKDYRLAFDLTVKHSACDPSFANVVPCEGKEVHGVAIIFDEKDMEKVSNWEKGYDLVTLPVHAYEEDGAAKFFASVFALTPAGAARHPEIMEYREQAPSARYLNMLVTGAIKIKLHEAYIDKLRAIETAELPQLEEHMTPKVLERIQARQFTQEDVVASKGKDPCYFVQKGIVFVATGWYLGVVGGQDATLMQCQRVRTIDSLDQVGDDHKQWINACVAERIMFEKDSGMTIAGMTNYLEYGW